MSAVPPRPELRREPIRTARVFVVAALVAAATTAGVVGNTAGALQPAGNAALSAQLRSILADRRLDGATVGLTVRDLDTGATLFDTAGSTRVLPASNAKLLTSAAALDVLGPGFRFTTSVLGGGARRGSTLSGDLYLKGTGDPMATAADYDALAARVAASGIRRVDGSVVADDSTFDDVRLAPFWSWDDEPYYYSAQTSALNISPDDIGDTGTVLVDIEPGARAGARPRIVLTPPNSYVHLRVTATTGAAGSASTIDATREYGRNVIDVSGSIPVGGAQYASQPTVDQPEGLAANVFERALARHGVRVVHPQTRYAATPAGAATLATHASITLSQLLTPWLKLSNNMIAEAVTKAMGVATSGAGTWAAGTKAILADVAKDGVDTTTLQLYDGSGLGRADYVTTDQVATLLASVTGKSWFPTWYAALPIAGQSAQLVGGTLRNRMAGTAAAGNLHAKTGSMTGVSALSGYVTDAAKHRLAFSMISNDFVLGGVTTLEDAVGVTLANYGGADATVVPRISPAARTAPAATDPRAQLECSWTRTC